MPISEWTPEVREIATLVRARTKDRFGAEVGTFNEDTKPNGEQASEMIQSAVQELAPSFGQDIPDALRGERDELRRGAKTCVSLLAAMNIEMSLYPEQVSRNLSSYGALEARFRRLFPLIRDAIAEAGGATSGDATAGGSNRPSYEFEEERETTSFRERW